MKIKLIKTKNAQSSLGRQAMLGGTPAQWTVEGRESIKVFKNGPWYATEGDTVLAYCSTKAEVIATLNNIAST